MEVRGSSSKEEGKPLVEERQRYLFHWLTSFKRPFNNKRKCNLLCPLSRSSWNGSLLSYKETTWIMMILLISYSSNYINYCVKIEFTKYRLQKWGGSYNAAKTFFIIHWIFLFTNSRYHHLFFQRLFFLYQLAIGHGFASFEWVISLFKPPLKWPLLHDYLVQTHFGDQVFVIW